MADIKLIIGYYGRNNIGDDLMLKVLYKNQQDFVFLQGSNFYDFIPYKNQIKLAKNPIFRSFQKAYYLIFLRFIGCSKIVFGGGTQFSENSSKYTKLDILCFIFGSIILGYKLEANSVGIGAFSPKSTILKKSLSLIDKISVRDKTSSNKLKNVGIKHQIKKDLIYELNFNFNKVINPKLVIITATGPVLKFNKYYLDNYLEFIKFNVVKHTHEIVYTVFQKDEDEFIYEILKKKLPNLKMITPLNIQELEELYNNCTEVLGMRYHSLVLADICGVNFKGFSYDDKVKDFCNAKNMEFVSAK